jgi:glycosyltransferase involved in cell wall biosynthesis
VKTLKRIAASTLSYKWEVLVIDNNSTDQTREVVENFTRLYPDRFRYLFEPRQGKSHALNTGIREARGEILAFTDDDLTVEPTWLERLTAALDGNRWAAVGGRVLLQKDVAIPSWLTLHGRYSMACPLALLDCGSVAAETTDPLIGANMAVRNILFERYGGFRTDLGPPPKIRGEDTEFSLRLVRAGERIWYEPSAIVYHAIEHYRLKRGYFLGWWFGEGRLRIRIRGGDLLFGASRRNASVLAIESCVCYQRRHADG